MGIISKILNTDGNGKPCATDIKFGRFAEDSETNEQMDLKLEAISLYEKGRHKEAYVTFFEYMLEFGGPAVNCKLDEYNNELNFSIIQGTKTIIGTITDEEVLARAVVAKVKNCSVALMRYLLSQCAKLAYSKFAISEGEIILCQKCPIKDMSPGAFRDMLSEISLTANSAAEFIAREFPNTVEPHNSNIVEIPAADVSLKVKYMRLWIDETFHLVESTENEKIRSVIILRLIFKILYLISPEGALLDKFNYILDIYGEYNPDENNSTEINYRMLSELEDVLAMQDREIKESIYMTYAVFPVLCYRQFQEVTTNVTDMMKILKQLYEIGRSDLVVAASEYVIGSQLARFGVHNIVSELFLVMFRAFNTEFFYGLGFREIWYNEDSKQMAVEKIKLEIEAITNKFRPMYGDFFNVENVCFESLEVFAYSFLWEFCNINQIID